MLRSTKKKHNCDDQQIACSSALDRPGHSRDVRPAPECLQSMCARCGPGGLWSSETGCEPHTCVMPLHAGAPRRTSCPQWSTLKYAQVFRRVRAWHIAFTLILMIRFCTFFLHNLQAVIMIQCEEGEEKNHNLPASVVANLLANATSVKDGFPAGEQGNTELSHA